MWESFPNSLIHLLVKFYKPKVEIYPLTKKKDRIKKFLWNQETKNVYFDESEIFVFY